MELVLDLEGQARKKRLKEKKASDVRYCKSKKSMRKNKRSNSRPWREKRQKKERERKKEDRVKKEKSTLSAKNGQSDWRKQQWF